MTKAASKKHAGAPIDWDELKARLSVDNVGTYSDTELAAIFAERADTLARAGQQREHKKPATHLSCRLGNVSILLPLAYVLRITMPHRVARVPGAPALLSQIMQVDGKIVAIADLRSTLGIDHAEESPKRIVVLLGDGVHRIALLVHALNDLVFVDEGTITPASVSTGAVADIVIGLSSELALVLDAQRLIHGLKAVAGSHSQGAAI